MRRNAGGPARATSLTVCTLVLITAGCSLFKKKEPVSTIDYGVGDPYAATPTADSTYPAATESTARSTDSYPTYGSAEPIRDAYDPAADPSALAATSSPRTHVVTKNDTLYALARSYYGDQRRWRDIYDANRANIGDPNKIRVGQRLVIP